MTVWTVEAKNGTRGQVETTDVSFLHAALIARRMWKEEYSRCIDPTGAINEPFRPPTIEITASDSPICVGIGIIHLNRDEIHMDIRTIHNRGIGLRSESAPDGHAYLTMYDFSLNFQKQWNHLKIRTIRHAIRVNYVADLDTNSCIHQAKIGNLQMADLINAATGPFTIQGNDIFFSKVANVNHIMSKAMREAGFSRTLTTMRPKEEEYINFILGLITKPTLLKTMVTPPENMYFKFTGPVQNWIAENDIKWSFSEKGYEFVNEEDYVLYKVMFT